MYLKNYVLMCFIFVKIVGMLLGFIENVSVMGLYWVPILKVVLSYLEFRFYRIGDLVVEQQCGIPIGSFMSSALLHLYLGACEHAFERSRWRQFARTNSLHGERSYYFHSSRYEGDLCVLSHRICRSCLKRLIDYVDKPSITVDVSDDCLTMDGSTTCNTFLDMRIEMTPTSFTLDLWHTNWASSVLWDPAFTKKYRFPFFG